MILKKSLVSLAAVTALSVASTGAALAEDNPWTLGVSVLSADVDNVETSSAPIAGVSRSLDIGTDSETGFGITIGRTLVEQSIGRLRAELAYTNSDLDVEDINFLGTDFTGAAVGGDVEVESIFARLVYEFELGLIDPYLGVGIGSTDVDINAVYGGSAGTSPGAQPPFVTDNDSDTSFELRVGANYSVSDHVDVFLEYSRVEADDLSFERLGGGPGGLQTSIQEGDVDIDTIAFGFTYSF